MQHIDRLVATPIEDLEQGDTLVWVDWRQEEDAIVSAVSTRLAPDDALVPDLQGEELWVTWRGARHRLPLTITPHDRYVAISSIAALLAGLYRFWVLKNSLDSDTHALLVLAAPEAADLETRHAAWAARHFEPLDIGLDYFNGIRVPYWGNENNNPDFEREARQMREAREAAGPALEAVFHQVMREAGIKPGFGLEAALKLARKPWWKFW
jgi:hypothetical protein